MINIEDFLKKQAAVFALKILENRNWLRKTVFDHIKSFLLVD